MVVNDGLGGGMVVFGEKSLTTILHCLKCLK